MAHICNEYMNTKACAFINSLAAKSVGSKEEDTWYCVAVSQSRLPLSV